MHGVASISEDELAQKALEYKNEILDDSWDDGLNKYLRKIKA